MSDEADDLIEQAEAIDWSLRKALEDEEAAVYEVHFSKIERLAKNVIAAWDQADNLAYDVTYPPLVEAVMSLKAALAMSMTERGTDEQI